MSLALVMMSSEAHRVLSPASWEAGGLAYGYRESGWSAPGAEAFFAPRGLPGLARLGDCRARMLAEVDGQFGALRVARAWWRRGTDHVHRRPAIRGAARPRA